MVSIWKNGAVIEAPSEFTAQLAIDSGLDAVRSLRLAQLKAECAEEILSGYTSSALGSPHRYPSGVTDQLNMMGSVTASLLPALADGWTTPFWCADEDGIWAFRPHTAVEIRQAGSDGKAHVVTCQDTLTSVSAAVLAASDEDGIAAVVWPAS